MTNHILMLRESLVRHQQEMIAFNERAPYSCYQFAGGARRRAEDAARLVELQAKLDAER